MGLNGVGGRMGGATGSTDESVGAAFWNPHSTARVWVQTVTWIKQGSAVVDNPAIIRSSTRGTQTVTVTPDIDNSYERDIASPTGMVLDLDFSAEPTLQGPHFRTWHLPAAVASGFEWGFSAPGLCIPPGTGLAVNTHTAVILQVADCSVEWME